MVLEVNIFFLFGTGMVVRTVIKNETNLHRNKVNFYRIFAVYMENTF